MVINELIKNKFYIFFGISFLINIFLLGLIVGNGLKKDFPRNMHFPTPPEFDHSSSLNQTLKDVEKNIEMTLLKEPYNKQEVIAALNKFDAVMAEFRKNIHERIADDAEKLPPKERLKLLPRRRHRR